MPSDGVVRARMHAYVDQGKAGPADAGLDCDDVLVSFGSNLQLHRVSGAFAVTRNGFRHFILAAFRFYATGAPGTAALDGLAISLELFVVKGDDFFGSVVGNKLRGHHFQRKSRNRKVHIGALLVVAGVFRSGLGAGIERQTDVADIGLLADVQIADGRLDVNVLLAILAIVVGMDAASGKHAERGKQRA